MKFRRFVALVAIVALPSLVCTVAAKAQSQRVAHNPGEIYYTCNEVDVHMWSFPLGNTTIHAKVTKAGRVIFDGDVTLTTVQAVAARYGLLRVPVDLSGANQVDTVLNWSTPADGPEPPKPYSDWVDNSSCTPPLPPQIVTVTVPVEVPVVVERQVPGETRTITVPSPPVVTTVRGKTRTVVKTKIVRVKSKPLVKIIHTPPKVIVRTVYRTVPTTPRTVTITVPGKPIPPCRTCQPKVAG